jgi:hypothetical protein
MAEDHQVVVELRRLLGITPEMLVRGILEDAPGEVRVWVGRVVGLELSHSSPQAPSESPAPIRTTLVMIQKTE